MMIEITGNLFNPKTYSLSISPDAICITVNGFVKNDGTAVMGRGCAKEAAKKWPDLPRKVGRGLQRYGNVVQIINQNPILLMFPVKGVKEPANSNVSNVVKHMRNRFNPGDSVPGWALRASRELICSSAEQLVLLANQNLWEYVVLPRPGCGAGELLWDEVKEDLDKILDQRFYSITFS